MKGKSTHSIPHEPVTDARPSHAIGHKATSCTPSSLLQDVAAFFAIVAFVAVFILFAAGLSS